MSKKDYTHIKANGLRNELKRLNENIEQLTSVLAQGLGVQTHKRNESTIIRGDVNDYITKRKGRNRLKQ